MTTSHEASIEADRRQLAIEAMRAKRAELQHAPLDRIYGELFDAGKAAYLAGDVVVPREATQAMIDAGQQAIPAGHGQAWLYAPHAYRAMVSAATEMEQK